MTDPTPEPVAVTPEQDARLLLKNLVHYRNGGINERDDIAAVQAFALTHSPAAVEREACAKVAETFAHFSGNKAIAAAIRARPAVPDGADQ